MYKNHLSVKLTIKNFSQKISFHFETAPVKDVNKIARKIKPNRGAGPHNIPPKLVKLSEDHQRRPKHKHKNLKVENHSIIYEGLQIKNL